LSFKMQINTIRIIILGIPIIGCFYAKNSSKVVILKLCKTPAEVCRVY
jgi:hypothetical protein